MARLRRLYDRFKLRINEAKSALAGFRKFLDFAFYAVASGEVRCNVAVMPMQAFKHKVRRLT